MYDAKTVQAALKVCLSVLNVTEQEAGGPKLITGPGGPFLTDVIRALIAMDDAKPSADERIAKALEETASHLGGLLEIAQDVNDQEDGAVRVKGKIQ